MKNRNKGTAGKRSHTRRTDKQKTAIVNRFKNSGLTVSAHCRNEGIYASQFYAWKNEYSNGEHSDALITDFIQVTPQTQTSHLEIVLPNGIQIKTTGLIPETNAIQLLMGL